MGESQVTSDVSEMMKEKDEVYAHADMVQNYAWGDFDHHTARLIQAKMFHYWYMIFTKLCRLMFNPKHIDSWRDIIGYATLAIERMEAYVKDK